MIRLPTIDELNREQLEAIIHYNEHGNEEIDPECDVEDLREIVRDYLEQEHEDETGDCYQLLCWGAKIGFRADGTGTKVVKAYHPVIGQLVEREGFLPPHVSEGSVLVRWPDGSERWEKVDELTEVE